jgi:putative addiction module component (TIGR02574 family)
MKELEEILKLSAAERILAIEKIWDSIEPNEINVTTAQKEELDKRLERHKAGKTKFHTWEEIKKQLHNK